LSNDGFGALFGFAKRLTLRKTGAIHSIFPEPK
jgi:hypothetical protein